MSSKGLKKRLWEGSIVFTMGTVLLVSSFLFPFHSHFPASMQSGDSFTIKRAECASLNIILVQGSITRGTLVINGGGSNVNFSVEDSSGNVVIAEREIRNTYDFEFQPKNTGSYVLIIDNSDDSVEKRVDWIVRVYFHNILFLLLGIINSAAGMFTVLREKKMLSAKVAKTLEKSGKDVDNRPITVRLVKTGNSIRLTIPKPIVDSLGLQKEKMVKAYVSNGDMIIEKT